MNLSRALIPDLAVLQAFECAARHENFTKAAAELNLTQSAVSRQIKILEAQLGVLLFGRIRKRVVLSAAGRKLLPEVSRLLLQSEEMVVRARASAGGREVLSIATLPTFGSRWLLPRLPDFKRRHPGTAINVASRAEPFDLSAEDFDLAIHYGQPVWAHATCTYLCSEIILPVASPSLIGSCTVERLEDLEDKPLLHLATRPKLWAEWFEHNDLSQKQAYRGDRFDQFAMIIEAAVRSLGFALLPLYLIEDEISSGRLRVVFERPMTTDNSYYVVLPEERQGSAVGRAFQSWLLEQVGTNAFPIDPGKVS
ncbi:LysR family transcriptional regulator [Mesorhizobium waimense]|uniref:LysR family transcriptional regulator n=1 Tax=Mesorhizobium waimense TaxID=1300307 RepID=A0A3A5KX90_9HYPH|nr:LysR family transcriptional regulator [Mesorhizobium waimense]RJT41360.1 LysR family transcriptional regulator [Mesorhizobium waimense]